VDEQRVCRHDTFDNNPPVFVLEESQVVPDAQPRTAGPSARGAPRRPPTSAPRRGPTLPPELARAIEASLEKIETEMVAIRAVLRDHRR
jgi:hypothetical protein